VNFIAARRAFADHSSCALQRLFSLFGGKLQSGAAISGHFPATTAILT
jgi:hypothetical protein